MWGLTGNMDLRLVSDGKALDVAYDAGKGKAKRTAEVTIEGKASFQLARMRMCVRHDSCLFVLSLYCDYFTGIFAIIYYLLLLRISFYFVPIYSSSHLSQTIQTTAPF